MWVFSMANGPFTVYAVIRDVPELAPPEVSRKLLAFMLKSPLGVSGDDSAGGKCHKTVSDWSRLDNFGKSTNTAVLYESTCKTSVRGVVKLSYKTHSWCVCGIRVRVLFVRPCNKCSGELSKFCWCLSGVCRSSLTCALIAFDVSECEAEGPGEPRCETVPAQE